MQSVETPQTRWEQLGLDIFSLKNTHYLLVVDYFSQFPIVRKLQSLHSVRVIKHLKEIFTEIGVPRCIVSDDGTQFTSQEFKDFMRMWNIQHRVTSPTNAQSNGQAECFVQTIKNSLTKAMEGGEDIYLAILSYITMCLNHSLPSPAELLNSRKSKCLLPLWTQQQNHTHQYRRMMQHQKHKQAKYYNKSAKYLPSLKTGDAVYVQLVPNVRRWTPAIIVETLSVRSYRVKTPKGGVYVRNRKFIRIKHTDSRQSLKATPKDTVLGESITHANRPKRITRKPQRLIESMNFIWTRNTQGRFV